MKRFEVSYYDFIVDREHTIEYYAFTRGQAKRKALHDLGNSVIIMSANEI